MLATLAAELVKLNVEVILTEGSPAVAAARKATTAIAIVTASFADPVGSGFAASLSRPGGNITGLANLAEESYAKRLELMMSVVPKVTRIAWLSNPDNAAAQRVGALFVAAAEKSGKTIVRAEARSAGELTEAFSRMAREKASALLVSDDSTLNPLANQVAGLALRHRLPSMFALRKGAESGGLMSYGADYAVRYRRAAVYVDKILKGEKAGDLPIEQPTEFELIVNLGTAKTLGLKIPESVLIRAARVIEWSAGTTGKE